MRFFVRVSAFGYRRGLGRRMGPTPLLLLTTVGAKSGEQRTTPVGWFRDGDNWIVAATFAGSASHPAWYRNLVAHPDDVWVEVGSSPPVPVHATQLSGEERGAWWHKIRESANNFRNYEAKTDRQFPIVRLSPL